MSEMSYSRMRDEGRKAFQAFVVYRDMGETRSIKRTARQIGKSVGYLSFLSQKFHWVARISLWEAHLDTRKRDRQARDLEEMSVRHATIACMFQQRVLERLERMTENDLDAFTPDQLMNWFVQSSRVEMRSRGEPDTLTHARTQNTHVHAQAKVEVIQTIVHTPEDVQHALAHPQGELLTG